MVRQEGGKIAAVAKIVNGEDILVTWLPVCAVMSLHALSCQNFCTVCTVSRPRSLIRLLPWECSRSAGGLPAARNGYTLLLSHALLLSSTHIAVPLPLDRLSALPCPCSSSFLFLALFTAYAGPVNLNTKFTTTAAKSAIASTVGPNLSSKPPCPRIRMLRGTHS